jgi:hypothetical protein
MQTARQDMMASLLKHLDSMSGPVYTETDQELFYEDLVSITKVFHELDETVAKSMRPKFSKIFGSFELKSDQAFESAVKHSMNAMIALGRQAAGSSVALDVIALIKQAQEACKDQAIRHHFNVALFGTRLRENSLDETVLQAVTDLSNLQAKSDKFETMVAFMDSLPQFCATLAESRAKSSPEAKQTLMQSVMRLKANAEKTAAAAELLPHVTHLEEICGIQDSAKALYTDALIDFKNTVSSIFEAGLKAFHGEGASNVCGVEIVGTTVYTLKQHAAYSDTPHHDREAIDLTHKLLPLCRQAGVIADLKTTVPDNFVLEAEVVEALSTLLADLESSKPKVQWLLGTELADKFLFMAKDMSVILGPVKKKDVGAAMKKVSKAIKNLSALLSDDSAAVSDDVFFEKMSKGPKLEKIRSRRAEAKTIVQEARVRHEVCGIPLPEELIAGEALLLTARRQIMKYACMAMAFSADATADTEIGKAVRKNLKSVWDIHCTDDEMLAYFGSSLATSIKTVLEHAESEPAAGVMPHAEDDKHQGQLLGSKRPQRADAAAEAQAEPGPAKKRCRGKSK